MQTPDNLTPTMRSYMRDPEAFLRRMLERAETLFWEDYEVKPGDGTGKFTVTTPKGDAYTVNALSTDTTARCTCPYAQKGEVPEVSCKHFMGLENLIAETLSQLRTFVEQHNLAGFERHAAGRRAEYDLLNEAWNATLDELMDRQAEAYTEEF
jgi:hypothetical protein